MAGEDMRRFWDARAREDAYHFVDSRQEYGRPDLEQFWAQGERDLDGMLALLGSELPPGATVLDLGCGVGRLTRPLAERAGRVIALDVSPEMLARARDNLNGVSNVEFLLGDGTSLAGVADGSVDAVLSSVVLQHIPDQEVILGYVGEIGRVLGPGGWAALQVSTDPAAHRGRLRDRFAVRGPRGRSRPEWLGAAVDMDRLRAMAGAAGLDVARVVNPGHQFTGVALSRSGYPEGS